MIVSNQELSVMMTSRSLMQGLAACVKQFSAVLIISLLFLLLMRTKKGGEERENSDKRLGEATEVE